MPPLIINPIPAIITIAAVLGVFVHDTQLGSVTIASMSVPAIVSDYSNGHIELLRSNHHTHPESNSSLSSAYSTKTQQPAAQPRNKDDKKYISQRRIMGNTFGNDYCWPSI